MSDMRDNSDGELVESCMENTSIQLELIHNFKLPKLFNSCYWTRGYNPNLHFVRKRLAHLTEKKNSAESAPEVTTSTNLSNNQTCHNTV